VPLAWTSSSQIQSSNRSTKLVVAQRTPDPIRGGTGRSCCSVFSRTIPVACLAFEQGQRFDVAHQLFEAESIGLSKTQANAGLSKNRLAKFVGMVERGSTARAAQATLGERPIGVPPGFEDCLTRSCVAPGSLPADQCHEEQKSSTQKDAGEEGPESGNLVGLLLD
jgi:hypothetical protein